MDQWLLKALATFCTAAFLVSCDGAVFNPPTKNQDAPRPGSHPTALGGQSEDARGTNHNPKENSGGVSLQKRQTSADVFLAMRDELSLYEGEDGQEVLCKLQFGDQLLIREQDEKTLKLRLDLYAYTDRQCPRSATYAYVRKKDAGQAPAAPGPQLITEESVAVFSDDANADEVVCQLPKGAQVNVKARRGLTYTQIEIPAGVCESAYQGLAVMRDPRGLSLAERYHRVNHLRPFTLAQDAPLYLDASLQGKAACTLARGNVLLESEKEKAVQMLASEQCPADLKNAYFKYFKGLWYEELPE